MTKLWDLPDFVLPGQQVWRRGERVKLQQWPPNSLWPETDPHNFLDPLQMGNTFLASLHSLPIGKRSKYWFSELFTRFNLDLVWSTCAWRQYINSAWKKQNLCWDWILLFFLFKFGMFGNCHIQFNHSLHFLYLQLWNLWKEDTQYSYVSLIVSFVIRPSHSLKSLDNITFA